MLYVYNSGREDALDDYYRVLDALDELRKRGVAPRLINGEKELSRLKGNCADSLVIPFSFRYEMYDLIAYCNRIRVPVITVHNYPNYFNDCAYSTISRDNFKCIRMVLSYIIYNTGKAPGIAYFGTTPSSLSDRPKIEALYSMYKPMEQGDIYFNDTCFSDCFERFFKNRKRYDALICANSYIAVAFLKTMRERDPEYLKKVITVSFLETKIAALYDISVTIAAYNKASIYDSVMKLYKMINKTGYISAVDIKLDNEMIIRESAQGVLPADDVFYSDAEYGYDKSRTVAYPTREKHFTEYINDPYLKNIVLTERLLCSSDITDLKVMHAFLCGKKNKDISEELFISLQTVQYRSRRMLKALEVEKRGDFVKILSEYVNTEKLSNYIKSREQ